MTGPRAPFSVVEHHPPVESPDGDFPFVLTTGRRLDSYNTGVQTGSLRSPLRRGVPITPRADGRGIKPS